MNLTDALNASDYTRAHADMPTVTFYAGRNDDEPYTAWTFSAAHGAMPPHWHITFATREELVSYVERHEPRADWQPEGDEEV